MGVVINSNKNKLLLCCKWEKKKLLQIWILDNPLET